MIKGKSPEEIRKTFNIKNDFTEEEEAQVNILVTVVVMSRHVKLAARQVLVGTAKPFKEFFNRCSIHNQNNNKV